MPDPWFAYIIQSKLDESFYIGHTHDLNLRLSHHNDGWAVSTKGKRPWTLVYSEQHESKSAAMKRERQIKKMKSRKYIERLIGNAGGRPDPK